MRVDLNADVGEGTVPGAAGDAELLQYVTSASIACGSHAGTPATMRTTVELARSLGVAIGAHPSFADREGFGRREMRLTPLEIESLVSSQIHALSTIARACGVRLQHVKPHGALYNLSARDESVAMAIARAVKACDPTLTVMGLAGSALISAAERVGLRAAGEGFADRSYCSDGTLVPRHQPNAVLTDRQSVVDQAMRLIGEGIVVASTGERIHLRVDTLCIHGDTPGAPVLAAGLRAALLAAGVTLKAVGAP